MSASIGSGHRVGWGARVRERLALIAPPWVWRTVGAFAATLLTVVSTVGGLFYYVPDYQAALAGGICAASIAPSRRSAAIVAAFAVFLGIAAGPEHVWDPALTVGAKVAAAAVAGLLSAAVAAGAKWLARRTAGADRWLVWGVIGLILANVWVSSIRVAGMSETDASGQHIPSLFEALEGAPVPTTMGDAGDSFAYLQVLKDVEQGKPFYQSWHDELGPNRKAGESAGSSVFNYNLPTRFWFWALLPGPRARVFYAYLVLMSLAVVSVPVVVRGTVRLPLAIPGAAAAGSYLFVYGYWISVLTGEPWAGILTLLSVAAWALSTRSARWRPWTLASVALGVAAALFREPAVLVPVAGLAAAILVRDEQRRFRAAAWGSGLAFFAACYAAHYLNARPLLWGTPTGALIRLSGIDTIISALTVGMPTMGVTIALPMVLAVAGLLGITLLTEPRTRWFTGLVVGLSMLAYLFVNNAARNVVTGAPVNYWGTVILPTIHACVPAAFAILPALGVEREQPLAAARSAQAPSKGGGRAGRAK